MTAEHHTLAKYFLELTMIDYDMVHFPPSQVASAAYALTLKVFDCGDWVSWQFVPSSFALACFLTILLAMLQTPTLQHYMGYTEDALVPVMRHIAKNVVRVNEGLSKHLVSALGLLNCSSSCWGFALAVTLKVFALFLRLWRTSTPVRSRWELLQFLILNHPWSKSWPSKSLSVGLFWKIWALCAAL